MKKSYQKWLFAAGVVAVIMGVLNLTMLLLVKYNHTISAKVTQMIYEYFTWMSGTSHVDILKYVTQNLMIGAICNTVVGAYMIFMAVRSTILYYKRQSLLGLVVVIVVLFGEFSFVAIILYIIAIFQANRRATTVASMPKTSIEMKRYQLLNAQEYAKKLKELRDRGEISEEEFLQQISVVTETMTTLMEEIANDKEK